MRYRIHEIKLNIYQDKSRIPEIIERRLGKRELLITNLTVVRESVDARNKGDIKFVYTVDFDCDRVLDEPEAPDMSYEYVRPASTGSDSSRPVIAGFGPCGIFCALIMAQVGMRPIVIERGKPARERAKDVQKFWDEGILNAESNVQFGEGGAGAFSDGKLTTGIKDKRVRKVLEELAAAGAGDEILYKSKPHMGTDVLSDVVTKLRSEIESRGGEVLFETKLDKVLTANGEVSGIEVIHSGEKREIPCKELVLAIGHSARDTFEMLREEGIPMEQKPFSIGVRIEHPQEMIDAAQYGKASLARKLGHAEYKLSHKCKDGRGVYTFCMCPGGRVICASSEEGGIVSNGMSNRARDGEFANSGLLVDVRTTDFPSSDVLAGVEFQKKYERLAYENAGSTYTLPQTRWEDFEGSRVEKCLPAFATESIKEAMPHLAAKLRGFNNPDAILKAVETRSSSPVRILRDKNYRSEIKGIYPAGEGAGYAGGIVSAAVDGIKIAEEIASHH